MLKDKSIHWGSQEEVGFPSYVRILWTVIIRYSDGCQELPNQMSESFSVVYLLAEC